MSTQLNTLEKQLTTITAAPLTITTPKQMEQASDRRATLKKIEKAAKAEKDKVLKPLNAARAAELARWKPLETDIDFQLSIIDKEMTKFQTEQQAIADAAAEKIAARVGEGRGKFTAETAVRKLQDIDTPAPLLSSGAGATSFRPTPCFEVTDLSLVPIEYHLPHDALIRQAMREGKELPGVRYWIEQRPVNR